MLNNSSIKKLSVENNITIDNTFSGSTRIKWVDIAKGIGILLVVLGHSGFPQAIQWWIWSFHMPLFFFISGLFFNNRKYPSYRGLLIKRLKNLIIPYIFFSFIVMIGYYYISPNTINNLYFTTILYGWGGIALWFIPVLFFTEILYFFIIDNLESKSIWFFLVVLSLLGYYFSLENIHFPYKMEVVFTSIAFFGIGNLLSDSLKEVMITSSNLRLLTIASMLLLLNVFLCFINSSRLDLCFNELGFYPISYLAAIAGIGVIFLTAAAISSNFIPYGIYLNQFLSFLGVNSIIILGIHQVVMMILIESLKDYNLNPVISSLIRHPLLWFIMLLSINILNTYVPVLIGKRR